MYVNGCLCGPNLWLLISNHLFKQTQGKASMLWLETAKVRRSGTIAQIAIRRKEVVMTQYGTDPVSAIAEDDAVGEVAEIFADIRNTMDIPLLTSIWRTLASIDGGLKAVWGETKPLYLAGYPQAALHSIFDGSPLPKPQPLVAGQLECVGVSKSELVQVRSILAAYNRSNGMNMLALSCLLVEPRGRPLPKPMPSSALRWGPLKKLLPKAEIPRSVWELLLEINKFGSSNGGGLATLWRHLARWPGFLSLLHAAFSPLQSAGVLSDSVRQVHECSSTLAARMAHINVNAGPIDMPESARQMIADYVDVPGAVTRMVTLGHAVERWLDQVGD